mmetsp:Transcript_107193/g.309989  ORF Transcript_107193/g.309989 Transcript_107193/m.309989 type:complete len:363 (+) Transcript_107193:96-1184(+)
MLAKVAATMRQAKLPTAVSGAHWCYKSSVVIDEVNVEQLQAQCEWPQHRAPDMLERSPSSASNGDLSNETHESTDDIALEVSAAEMPRLLGAPRPASMKMSAGNLSCASTRSSADGAGGTSAASDASPMSGMSEDGIEEPMLTEAYEHTVLTSRPASFESDIFGMPDFDSLEREAPLAAGRLEASLSDLADAMLSADGDGPLAKFLIDGLGCKSLTGGRWWQDNVDDKEASQFLRRCRYQLPLPADVPDVAIRLLNLEAFVGSSTTSRLSISAERITLQEVSQTEGLLYSERMRVMNVHVWEAAASGGVVWRSWTRTVWTKALPWTHAFIAKTIENRVKAEAKSATPRLMCTIAAELPGLRR